MAEQAQTRDEFTEKVCKIVLSQRPPIVAPADFSEHQKRRYEAAIETYRQPLEKGTTAIAPSRGKKVRKFLSNLLRKIP